MRLLAAARLAASGRARNASTARTRCAKSSGRAGCFASTALKTSGRDRAVREPGAQPLDHEPAHLRLVHLRLADSTLLGPPGEPPLNDMARERGFDHLVEIEVEPGLDDDAQHPEGGAAQGVGVLVPARRLPDPEDAGQRVELVGDRHPRAPAGVAGMASSAKRGM